MTTAAFNRINPHIARAITAVKTEHCAPPTYAPAERITGRLNCTKCGGRIDFTVEKSGLSSGRCNSAACVRWALQ
ncbi:hypothetical protein RCH27_08455 [Paracidovorax citrulli]|uniref:hypothetical protein n=1 Tax=Paracidovorax citrulli TaxID=80869 RepID=UPI003A80CAEA